MESHGASMVSIYTHGQHLWSALGFTGLRLSTCARCHLQAVHTASLQAHSCQAGSLACPSVLQVSVTVQSTASTELHGRMLAEVRPKSRSGAIYDAGCTFAAPAGQHALAEYGKVLRWEEAVVIGPHEETVVRLAEQVMSRPALWWPIHMGQQVCTCCESCLLVLCSSEVGPTVAFVAERPYLLACVLAACISCDKYTVLQLYSGLHCGIHSASVHMWPE